ncbi:MAG: hypothetical protein M3R70_04585 [Actinomycetota bacterium]|nr:hypothetical protein [Actinomycetota bacterium]
MRAHRHAIKFSGLIAAAFVALLTLVPAHGSAAPACTISWDGGSTGSWHTATNWDTNVVPGAADHACIPAGASVTFSSGTTSVLSLQSQGTLTLAGGTLNLTSATDASNVLGVNQSGGNLGGAATVNVGSGATFTWSGGSMIGPGTTKVVSGATLVQNGYTYLESGRILDNAGLIEYPSDRYLNTFGSPAPLLRNTGTIRKTGGLSTFAIYPAVDNDGSIVSNSGTLSLGHNGASAAVSTGSFGAPAATGKVQFDNGPDVLGAGARFLGGVVIDGTVNVAPAAALTMSGANSFTGGELGGAGTANIAGTLTWSGGSMIGPGTTKVVSGATLVQNGYTYLESGRILDNAGLIEYPSDRYLNTFGSPAPLLRNTGTIRKTAGSGTFTIYPGLTNLGRIDSVSGELALRRSGPGTQSGTFSGASDASHVVFDDDSFTLAPGTLIQGTVEIGGATVNVGAGLTLAIPGRLLLTSGVLGGPGTVNVTGTLVWKGGSQNGPGRTVVPSGGNLSIEATCVVYLRDGRQVQNNGTVTLLRHSSLGAYGTSRSVIDNAGRIVLDDGGSTVCTGQSSISGDLLLNNTGILTKSGTTTPSTQISYIDALLDNDGTVDVKAGWLNLSSTSAATQTGMFASTGGATSTLAFYDGTFRMGPGARLSGQTAINGARVDVVTGNTLEVRSGDTLSMSYGDVGGDGTFLVAGTFKWSGGYHDGSGTTAFGPTANVTLDGTFYSLGMQDGRALVNRGSVIWTTGYFWLGNGSSIVNAGTIELRGESTLGGGTFSGWGYGSLLHNAGLLKKTGTTTANLEVPIDNDGTIEVSGGVLAINGQLLNYGAPAKTLTAGGYVVHNATLRIPADVALNASTLVLDGATSKVVYPDPVDDTIMLDALAPFSRNAGAGELTLDNRSMTTKGPLRNAGIATLRHSSTLTTTGAYTQSGGITNLADTTTRLAAAGAKAQVTAGRFGGVGSVGPELAATGGEISPGLGAAGILRADKYSSGAGATLRMQIGGAAAGTGFDRLAVTGAASLGGTLALSTASGFHPAVGSTFKIMTFASRTGTFAAVIGAPLGVGLSYEVLYNATDVTLRVRATPASTPAPAPAPTAPPATASTTSVDDAALAVVAGPWVRKRSNGFFGSTYSVAQRRDAALARAGVVADRIAVRVATCRRCGTIAVLWNGKLLRRFDLRARGPQKARLLQVAKFKANRSGTLVIRVLSRRRLVAVDALVLRRS